MTSIPHITIQLIHIFGPLKGHIHELDDSEIEIGRHPECQVQFPKDQTAISRRHARIIREGNRFKLVDQSTNGCYVNGQRVNEVFLKDGDVITLSESGPKLSFLAVPHSGASQQTAPAPVRPQEPPPVQPVAPIAVPPPSPGPMAAAAQSPSPMAPVQSVKIPLAIQYGAALKSFQTLPVVLGSGPGADFSINHPAVIQRHVQFFYAENQYWIKDLTGTGAVSINGLPIAGQAPLEPECEIALSPEGPKFRFLGGGRLAEIEMPQPGKSATTAPPPPQEEKAPEPPKSKKGGALFKKFFS